MVYYSMVTFRRYTKLNFVCVFDAQNFMEHIDAIDNGVDVASTPVNYDVSTHLSSRVAALAPR